MQLLKTWTEYNVFIKSNNKPSHVLKTPVINWKRYYEGRITKVLEHEKILRQELSDIYVDCTVHITS